MKKSLCIVLGGLVFATLFYNQRLGLNVLLYNIFIIIALAVNNKMLVTTYRVLGSATAMIVTAAAVMVHGTTAAILMSLLSTLTFIGFVAYSAKSIYVSWLHGMYNLIAGTFHDFLFQIEAVKNPETAKINTPQVAKLIIVPLFLVILFATLYKQINPVFSNWINHIDLSFLNGLWIFTAVIGSFIMSNIIQPGVLQPLATNDTQTLNELTNQPPAEAAIPVLKNQLQLGTYSFAALNLLLTVVLVSEVLFLITLDSFKASALSQAVHHGVYASIVSILLAIGIIAFYYRGALNFLEDTKTLRVLTYVWIALNAVLISTIFAKNYLYIDLHGLTYKRIGVMVYLLLCLAGLVTTYLKVRFKLNFTYLLRRNTAISYVVLCVFALINWPAVITAYNIEHNFKNKQLFMSLLPQNALILEQHNLLEVTAMKYNYQQKESEINIFKTRNWQEFNLVAYKLKTLQNGKAQNLQSHK